MWLKDKVLVSGPFEKFKVPMGGGHDECEQLVIFPTRVENLSTQSEYDTNTELASNLNRMDDEVMSGRNVVTDDTTSMQLGKGAVVSSELGGSPKKDKEGAPDATAENDTDAEMI